MRSRPFWVGIAAVAILAGAVAAIAGFSGSSTTVLRENVPLTKGGDPDNAQALAGNFGEPGDASAAEVEAALNAFPAEEITAAQTAGAIKAFNDVKIRGNKGSKKKPGIWNAIGPTRAIAPAILTQAFAPWVLGQDYVSGGRTTAMAISPACNQGNCTLWIGVAGGGVWKTDHALHTNNLGWTRSSNGLTSNAIGALAIDPNNPNVLYAGTGEPNASGDSEAGVGIFKSTDGGDSWSLLPGSVAVANTRAVSEITIDPTNSNIVYAAIARAVRGISHVTGGAISRTGTPQPTLGVYKSTDGGNTWSLIWDAGAGDTLRGATQVELDPNDHTTVYAGAFTLGIYRSKAGASFQQVYGVQNPASANDKPAFALASKNGKTRVYAIDGAAAAPSPFAAKLFRVDDASLLVDGSTNAGVWKNITSDDRTNPYYGPYDICTLQCVYDLGVVSPKGQPDTVYVYGSYVYAEAGLRSNARGLIKSTTAGEPDPSNANRAWADLTYDSHRPALGMHPDQHVLVFDPDNPNIYFEGSDGGVIRNDGTFSDATSQCQERVDAGLIGAASFQSCMNLLWAVPTTIYSLNDGLDTLQFTSFSASPSGNQLQGGTQDNGTWLYNGSSNTWNQTIYGDGGNSGYDVGNSSVRFNQFFLGATDTNFRNGDPASWVITSGPLLNSPESAAVAFYWPQIADPKVSGTLFTGMQHVWRTQDNGGNQAFLEANCQEFTVSAANPACGDWVTIGEDLTAASFGDKAGLNSGLVGVSQVERANDNDTLWAATATGRVFISKNAQAAPAAMSFKRLDSSAQPNRFVTAIDIDPNDPNHAYVSYGGYNTTVGSTAPGHVYEVRYNPSAGTATWTNISYDLGDLPITDLALDTNGDLYAANDFTVLRLDSGGNSWVSAGDGLPPVEISGLTILPSQRKLYAATHGLGGWMMNLP
jgi:hypothetical protein